jgi:hypothetical protein
MDDDATSHAMTEIALALAMAFFCLLVLALVSMGPGATAPEKPGSPFSTLRLSSAAHSPDADGVTADDQLVLVRRGRFFDRVGRPVEPSAVSTEGRLFLAIDPDIPLVELLEIRARFSGRDVRLTPMDEAWRARLDQRAPALSAPSSPEIVR